MQPAWATIHDTSPLRLAMLALGAMLLASPVGHAHAAEALDATPRLAIASAYEPEWLRFRADLEDRQEHVLNGRAFLTGRLVGKDVVLFLSGVSMVNAAMTTQLALDRFAVTAVIFSGIAGGVDPALDIGDVVIAGQWGQYLEAVFARKTDKGYVIPPFFEQAFPAYGMIVPTPVSVARKGGEGEESRFWFASDPALLAVAQRIAKDIELQRCVAKDNCLSQPPQVIVGGNGVSGQAFVDNAEFRKYVFATFQAKVLDMESAAAAQVAYANAVPFLAVRSLSDLAGGGEGANELETFFVLAANNSATVVEALIAALP